jgi:hypothetical protein
MNKIIETMYLSNPKLRDLPSFDELCKQYPWSIESDEGVHIDSFTDYDKVKAALDVMYPDGGLKEWNESLDKMVTTKVLKRESEMLKKHNKLMINALQRVLRVDCFLDIDTYHVVDRAINNKESI